MKNEKSCRLAVGMGPRADSDFKRDIVFPLSADQLDRGLAAQCGRRREEEFSSKSIAEVLFSHTPGSQPNRLSTGRAPVEECVRKFVTNREALPVAPHVLMQCLGAERPPVPSRWIDEHPESISLQRDQYRMASAVGRAQISFADFDPGRARNRPEIE